eukprot:c28077_g1_i1 orf=553-1794(-)
MASLPCLFLTLSPYCPSICHLRSPPFCSVELVSRSIPAQATPCTSKNLNFTAVCAGIDQGNAKVGHATTQCGDDETIGRDPCSYLDAARLEAGRGCSQHPVCGRERRKRVFFLDVYPLCYRGRKPQPSRIVRWMRMLFSQVADKDPIIAVMDGERGNEYRRSFFAAYKATRNNFVPLSQSKDRQTWKGDDADLREALPCIESFLNYCNVPVIKIEDAEADDVVASFARQAIQKGMHVAIASPDKDFRQMLCEDVEIVVPQMELGYWSFYTIKHYIGQYGCDPSIELGLRCMLGDQIDNIPGLSEFVPGFGRKTALKLMKKHGTLENLLNAATIRTIGKPHIQNAVMEHALILRRNLKLLALRRDLPVVYRDEWCFERDSSKDSQALLKLKERLQYLRLQRAEKAGIETVDLVS